MNREILFRGKRTDNNKWVYGNLNILNGCVYHIVPLRVYIYTSGIPASEFYDVVPKSISQFTGLTDKNGKKIFEGDILDYFGTLYIVSWSDNLLTYIVTSVSEKKEYLFYLNKANMDCVYIIGNIYDNPELLEVE